MAYFAGWELVDGQWNFTDPGTADSADWSINVAETDLTFITIVAHGTRKDFFFGANPSLIYGVEPENIPVHDSAELIEFFVERYPERRQEIVSFVETFQSVPGDAAGKFVRGVADSGADLIMLWCKTLDIEPPQVLADSYR